MRDYGDNSVSFVNEYNMSTFVNMSTNPVRKRHHVDISATDISIIVTFMTIMTIIS